MIDKRLELREGGNSIAQLVMPGWELFEDQVYISYPVHCESHTHAFHIAHRINLFWGMEIGLDYFEGLGIDWRSLWI